MRPTFVLVALMLLALAAAACNDASDDPAPTSTPLATHGELVVYREVVRTITSPERLTPVWRIAAFDLNAGTEFSSFEVGAEGEVPFEAALAGGRVVVTYESRVATYALDGSGEVDWYRAPVSGYITGASPSPDGRMLAVSLQREDPCATAVAGGSGSCRTFEDFYTVLVLDQTGDEVLKVDQSDPRFDDFAGNFASIVWRDDGAGFVVHGYTQSEAPGGIATIMLDGDVVVSPVRVYGGYVSPNGRYVYGDDWVACDLNLAIERHALRIVDLVTNDPLAETTEPVRNIAPLQEWSPDGGELVYRTADLEGNPDPQNPCLVENMETATWHILRAGSDAPIDVAGVIDARRDWYGDRLIEFECGGEPTEFSECYVANQNLVTRVLNQGLLITEAFGYETIGYLPASAPD